MVLATALLLIGLALFFNHRHRMSEISETLSCVHLIQCELDQLKAELAQIRDELRVNN